MFEKHGLTFIFLQEKLSFAEQELRKEAEDKVNVSAENTALKSTVTMLKVIYNYSAIILLYNDTQHFIYIVHRWKRPDINRIGMKSSFFTKI